jgi:hypothetical protein
MVDRLGVNTLSRAFEDPDLAHTSVFVDRRFHHDSPFPGKAWRHLMKDGGPAELPLGPIDLQRLGLRRLQRNAPLLLAELDALPLGERSGRLTLGPGLRSHDQRQKHQDRDAEDLHRFSFRVRSQRSGPLERRARVSVASVVRQYRPKLTTVVTTVPRKKRDSRRAASRRSRAENLRGEETRSGGVSRIPIGLTRGGST